MHSWSAPDSEHQYKIDAKMNSFQFEIPSCYEYFYSGKIIDGNYFDVVLEYSNEAGTRKQQIKLVPEKL